MLDIKFNINQGVLSMSEKSDNYDELNSKESSIEVEETIEENKKENNEDINYKEVIEKLNLEVTTYKDKYLRAYADFDNSKRRLEKDKYTAVSYANESFATDILAVLDSFESALTSIKSLEKDGEESEIFKKVEDGINLTFEQLKKILIKNNIVEIDSTKEFNPEHHQAIMQVEDENIKSGNIVQVMQKGYMIKDRVLRPAMVSTSK